ncbi:MAG TPA: hypothetical protein VLB73_01330 [Patescibacteria group bacterium]|nr:hypothetical protein [Patescibacteria group bacterium]
METRVFNVRFISDTRDKQQKPIPIKKRRRPLSESGQELQDALDQLGGFTPHREELPPDPIPFQRKPKKEE